MRITNEKKQENRERIVVTASELFRERGFDGVGVADLMERAGFTHGGFYNHFGCKEDLIAEATAKGFSEPAARNAGRDALAATNAYVSRAHRDARGQGCPAAALAGDAARLQDETRSTFATGIESMVKALEQDMVRKHGHDSGVRARAISVLAQAVGAIVLSRACPDESSLANEILDVCRADCRASIKRAGRK